MTTLLTNFSHYTEGDPLLTGREEYPIRGGMLTQNVANQIQTYFGGLRKHWHCLEKAQVARRLLNTGIVVVGRMYVLSGDKKSTYGYEFNPPFEFHSWLQCGDKVVDFALPGVIEKGLHTSDQYGPFLIGINPFILAGTVPDNLFYEVKEVVNG